MIVQAIYRGLNNTSVKTGYMQHYLVGEIGVMFLLLWFFVWDEFCCSFNKNMNGRHFISPDPDFGISCASSIKMDRVSDLLCSFIILNYPLNSPTIRIWTTLRNEIPKFRHTVIIAHFLLLFGGRYKI
jgi:hypothetical protein